MQLFALEKSQKEATHNLMEFIIIMMMVMVAKGQKVVNYIGNT